MTTPDVEQRIVRLQLAIASDRLLLLRAVERGDRGMAHSLVDALIDAGRRLEDLQGRY